MRCHVMTYAPGNEPAVDSSHDDAEKALARAAKITATGKTFANVVTDQGVTIARPPAPSGVTP